MASINVYAEVGYITGACFLIFLLAIFLNFLIKKTTKEDTIVQRFFATLSATVLSMLASYDSNKSFPGEQVAGWLITVSFFAFKFSLKQFFIMLSYWALGSVFGAFIVHLIYLALSGMLADNVLAGLLGFYIAGLVIPLLVFKQKLPFTKIKTKGEK